MIPLSQFFSPAGHEQLELFAAHHRTEHYSDHDLFEGGPPTGLQTLVGLMRPGRANVGLRIAVAVGIGWLPLALATAVQSVTLHDGSFPSFLSDYSVHARLLVAVPLLIAAEKVCLPRLSAIARHFREAELIAPEDAARFRSAVASTRRLRDSMRLEVSVLALAVTVAIALITAVPRELFPPWHSMRVDGRTVFSLAGWWHGYVSVWILLVLVLGWLWRLVLWARFLGLIARLKLNLIAAHPDRAGGLKFVGLSAQAFAALGFAFSAAVAGTVANRVLHDGAAMLSFKYIILGYSAFVVALLSGPLLVFAPTLLSTWRRGVLEYGALARAVGQEMEHKWLKRAPGAAALDVNDFSATTDLYSVVSNVHAMGVVPVTLSNLAVLATATLLPFVPVVLMSVSPEIILQKLTGMLL